MSNWTMIAIIMVLSVFFIVILISAIGHFGNRTQYWQRQFGETRTWDVGPMGEAVLTYQLDPEDSNTVQMELALHQQNNSIQRTFWCFDRTPKNERDAYGLFIEATDDWVKDEAVKLTGYRMDTMREFGLKPVLKAIA